MTREDAPAFIDEKEAARRLCLSVRTLQQWRLTGGGPVYCKFGRSVRYSVDDINAFIAEHRRRHSSQKLP